MSLRVSPQQKTSLFNVKETCMARRFDSVSREARRTVSADILRPPEGYRDDVSEVHPEPVEG